MPASDTIYFITVNYNSSQHTIKYVESIDNIDVKSNKVIVIIVDNASSDKDFNIIINRYKSREDVLIIRNENNLGYFKGLNVGLMTLNEKYKNKVVIGNNDIVFGSDFINKLEEIQCSEETLVIAPNIITKDGYHQNPHVIERVPLYRRIAYRIYFSNYYIGLLLLKIANVYNRITKRKLQNHHEKRQYIYMGIGACYVLTENYFKHFKKLDDRVFLWGEEALLAGQVNSVNGKTLYEPNLIIHHSESSSISKMTAKEYYQIARESYKFSSRYL